MTQTTNDTMSPTEVRALRDTIDGRRKLAKLRAAARKAEILAAFEENLSAEYDAVDLGLAEVKAAANAVIEEQGQRINDLITRECDARGIPPASRPHWYAQPMGDYWARRGESATATRRVELRKLAERAAASEEKRAIAEIDQQALDCLEELLSTQLRSDDAQRLLGRIPKAEDLMPPLSVKGVEQMAAALGARSPEERKMLLNGKGPLSPALLAAADTNA